MRKFRLPRKMKKIFKNRYTENWEKFLEEKEAIRKREEHIDQIFTRNYTNVYKTFHKMLKHGR